MGKTIHLQGIAASSLLEKSLGLLTRPPSVMLFRTRFGIHTFGMKYPIDVLIVDGNHRVVKMKKTLKPNRIFLWHPKFDKVIELPEGTIVHEAIRVADTISFTTIKI